ncbi:MAG: leucine-rich repeat protein [Paludibacteraceae bacterium]|nr:leucine-rich repeat protein [Paludibacteraceae bacterium]
MRTSTIRTFLCPPWLLLIFVLFSCLSVFATEPNYLTLTNTGSNTVTIYFSKQGGNYTTNNVNIAYSINNGPWSEEITYGTAANNQLSLSLPAGQNVRFRGYNMSNGAWQFGKGNSIYFYLNLPTTTTYSVSGDIMSLVSYKDGELHTDEYPLGNYCFTQLFKSCTTLKEAFMLSLSAQQLGKYCYQSLFNGCTGLSSVPTLPATTLADYCYASMFNNCKAITQAPALPATTLAPYCYQYMFSGCSSLQSAPRLNSLTAEEGCYGYMFQNCTALTSAQDTLPATNMPKFCYQYMFSGCTSLIVAPEIMTHSDAITGQGACDNMFANCTNLTKAPSHLYADRLGYNLTYSHMFYRCSKLTEGPDIHASTISANNPLQYMYHSSDNLSKIRVYFKAWGSLSFSSYWTYNVAAYGAFYCPPELTRTYNSTKSTPSFIPDNWTVFSYNLTYIPVGGEWPQGGTIPQQYTWMTDTVYVQTWMRELDAAGAQYFHDAACTQPFAKTAIITFLATQQESSSDITKNIYVQLAATPPAPEFEYLSYPLSEEENQPDFVCTPSGPGTDPDPDPETPTGSTCEHDWVQLWSGGPKWATVNLGASNETETGNYYLYGGTTANPTCTWSAYPYKGSNQYTAPYTKYGFAGDGKLVLESNDDAATQAWGCQWRIPTLSEMNDLLSKCTVTYNQTKKGYTFTSKEDPTLSIFLPTAGYKNGSSVFNVGKYARYLTATSTASPASSTKDRDCHILYWYTNNAYGEEHKPETNTLSIRYWGMSIRPVCD